MSNTSAPTSSIGDGKEKSDTRCTTHRMILIPTSSIHTKTCYPCIAATLTSASSAMRNGNAVLRTFKMAASWKGHTGGGKKPSQARGGDSHLSGSV